MMANPMPTPDRLESLADAIDWISDCARHESEASPELRAKLKAARDQIAEDLQAKKLARSA